MPSVNAASIIGTGKNLAQGRDRIDAHWHNYDGVDLVNRTGAGLVAGDVVRLATTATAGSVALTDSVANHRPYVVAMATIADTALGEFARAGDVVAKSTGTIAIGDYVRKSATSKAIETTGVAQGNATAIPDGTLGIAIGASAGGFTRILLWPVNWIKTNNLLISGAGQTIQNTTTETDLTGSIASILAGTLPIAGGVVTVELAGVLNGWAEGNVPDKTCTFRFKYGTTAVVTITLTVNKEVSGPTLVNEPFEMFFTLSGFGATNAQRGYLTYRGRQATAGGIVEVTPVVRRGAATEDSTVTQPFKVTAQFNSANASNYLIVERVRVLQPPT